MIKLEIIDRVLSQGGDNIWQMLYNLEQSSWGTVLSNQIQKASPGGNVPRAAEDSAARRLQTMGKKTSKGQSLEAAHWHQEGPRSEMLL